MSTTQPTISPLQLTTFGLVRTTGAPFQIADLIHKYGVDANWWGQSKTGTGNITHVPLMSGAKIEAGGAVGTALLQSHEYWHYQAGCATRWKLTLMSSDSGNANNVREWGYTDFSDGLYFRHARNTANNFLDIVEVSTSGATSPRVFAQNAWSHDRLNGLGGSANPSGVTFDPTKQNIFEIDLQWLGAGIVRYFINGYLVHIVDHTNTYAMPYMRTGQLPTSIRVTEAGSAGASGVVQVCNAVHIEGGSAPASFGFGYERSAAFAVTNVEAPMLSIRPANLINAIANRTHLLPDHFHINAQNFAAGGTLCTLRFYLNSTLAGTNWLAVGGSSNAERDEAATIAGFVRGQLFALMQLAQNEHTDHTLLPFFSERGRKMMRRDYPLAPAPNLDILTMTAQMDAGTGTAWGGFIWTETT